MLISVFVFVPSYEVKICTSLDCVSSAWRMTKSISNQKSFHISFSTLYIYFSNSLDEEKWIVEWKIGSSSLNCVSSAWRMTEPISNQKAFHISFSMLFILLSNNLDGGKWIVECKIASAKLMESKSKPFLWMFKKLYHLWLLFAYPNHLNNNMWAVCPESLQFSNDESEWKEEDQQTLEVSCFSYQLNNMKEDWNCKKPWC